MAIKAQVRMKLRGNDVQNVLYFEGPGANLNSTTSFATQISSTYVDALQTRFPPEFEFRDVVFYDTDAPLGTPGLVVIPAGGAWNGTAASPALPNQICPMIRYTSDEGPPHRGRLYLPAPVVGSVAENGEWFPGQIIIFQEFADDLASLNIGAEGVVNQVLFRPNGGGVPGGISSQITGISIDPIPATQRRRRLGVGG